MQPLTLDDMLPLEEYASRRREFFEAQARYLDRHRRVRIGPKLTLLFENRQTLWFRVQEVLRIARLDDPDRVQLELDLYNKLLPCRKRLHAALLIEIDENAPMTAELEMWQGLDGSDLNLRIGERRWPAQVVTCRPEDRCIGTAHWVQFLVDDAAQRLLANFQRPAYFDANHRDYRHESPPLNDDIRQSLVDDLKLSDRDG